MILLVKLGLSIGYFRKKNQINGVEEIKVSGVLKKEKVEFPGVNYKQYGIYRGNQEKDFSFRP